MKNLYMVYRDDWECPEELFSTFDKEKAEAFIKTYNEINKDKIIYKGAFIIARDLDTIDEEADETIKSYEVMDYVTVDVQNNKINKVLKEERIYRDKRNIIYGDVMEDVSSIGANHYQVTVRNNDHLMESIQELIRDCD